MAVAPKLDPRQVVQTSRKLWSEIVEEVDPSDDNPDVYEFSGGRNFKERKP